MKYVILIMDGAADRPLGLLGGKTPLQFAKKQHLDGLALISTAGLLRTVPGGCPPGSDVANLSILGYAPNVYSQGRGVLEAANMGVVLGPEDVAFRCNTICVSADGRIKNHSAGHISSEESCLLIKEINEKLGGRGAVFYPGVSYRHLLVLRGKKFSAELECYPPHDYTGHCISELAIKPRNRGAEETADFLNGLAAESVRILENHPVNRKRASSGRDKANMIWPWSPGRNLRMATFQERFGVRGAVISAVDLIKGLGIYCGFNVIEVEGATGFYDTNYEGKARACVEALKSYDLVYVHVEAPDEAGHQGDALLKVRCIEDFDRRLLAHILDGVDMSGTSIAVMPDHYTPVSIKTHSGEPVPFMIFSPLSEGDSVKTFDEESCGRGARGLLEGVDFIASFLGRSADG